MARLAGKNANFSIGGVSIEDELASIEMSVDVNLPEVTSFGDTGGTFVEGLPTSAFSVSGFADFVAAQGDATIFNQIGAGTAAVIFQPTGNSDNVNDPNYKASVFVKSYRIRAEVAGPVGYDASLQVSGALTRDVTP